MLAYLFQHMVEEAEPGMNITMTVTVQIHSYVNIRFFRGTAYFRFPFTCKKKFSDFIPIFRCQSTDILQALTDSFTAG